jgi:GT2 family glycosyltransferase
MFAYLEDMDLCLRARECGTRSFFTTATEIAHFKGASFPGLPSRQTSYFLHSQILYIRKHWPMLARTLYLADRFVRYALPALWSGVTGNRQKRDAARSLMSLVVAGGGRKPVRRSNP